MLHFLFFLLASVALVWLLIRAIDFFWRCEPDPWAHSPTRNVAHQHGLTSRKTPTQNVGGHQRA